MSTTFAGGQTATADDANLHTVRTARGAAIRHAMTPLPFHSRGHGSPRQAHSPAPQH